MQSPLIILFCINPKFIQQYLHSNWQLCDPDQDMPDQAGSFAIMAFAVLTATDLSRP